MTIKEIRKLIGAMVTWGWMLSPFVYGAAYILNIYRRKDGDAFIFIFLSVMSLLASGWSYKRTPCSVCSNKRLVKGK